MLLLMETFNRWRPKVDHFSTELSKDLKTLASRVEVLEVNTAPLLAPACKEEGRATGHGVAQPPQGSESKAVVLPQPLAKGQYTASTSTVLVSFDLI
jgi:hypothetical protein